MEKELIKFEETQTSIPFIKVKHNNISFNLVIDTGCTTSCIDKEVLDEEYFRFHPFNGLITVKIKTKDLIEKLIPYLDHDYEII